MNKSMISAIAFSTIFALTKGMTNKDNLKDNLTAGFHIAQAISQYCQPNLSDNEGIKLCIELNNWLIGARHFLDLKDKYDTISKDKINIPLNELAKSALELNNIISNNSVAAVANKAIKPHTYSKSSPAIRIATQVLTQHAKENPDQAVTKNTCDKYSNNPAMHAQCKYLTKSSTLTDEVKFHLGLLSIQNYKDPIPAPTQHSDK